MAFDYKKEYKEFYAPPKVPTIIEIPPMNYLAVRGKGNPNEENGEYSRALNLLYPVAYTLKMSYKSDYKIEGFFEYVVPPLEGFWWQAGIRGVDYSNKETFCWISIIRLPDFITKTDFDWAINKATKQKKTDFSFVEFFPYNEGLCVQCMHIGPYDNEPETVQLMEKHAKEQGYIIDISDERHHHEIYLSDPRKTAPDKLKTVIRHPVKRV
ncbi:MAG: GyrI-like domain-containing protein [Eubacteriales bacterium]|nr:GyrI-like domain-containing protein [Eubacteriales bacterium]